MKTSVIIPTYQGEKKIGNCIDALLNQSYQDFEIIIAIDGSTDKTMDIAESKLKEFKSYKIIRQENQGRSVIRNFAVKNASGDLLIFYDDDTRPITSSVQQHINHHTKHPNTICQGSILSDNSNLKSDIQLYKYDLDVYWGSTLENTDEKLTQTYLSAANFSISKNTFTSLDGFDEKLRDDEDYDLAYRSQERDISTFYYSDNIVYHNDPITCRSYIKRKREYSIAQKKLSSLYPERYAENSSRKFVARKGIKAMIYRIISNKSLVSLIDKESILVMILPRKWRHKLYDIVIQGLSKYYPNIDI